MIKRTEQHNIMETEVIADCYGGDKCDEVSKEFHTYCDGDRASEKHTDDIIINLNDLPVGANIVVSYPCCPKCYLPREDKMEFLSGKWKIVGHNDKCECGFDWNEWALGEFL